MRVELYFTPERSGVPDRAAFERYFSGRDRYTVRSGTAEYANDDTSVTFSFDCHGADYPEPAAGRRAWARFAVHVVRPSFFAEESLAELEAFTTRFGPALVYPPDPDFTTYNKGVFLKSWEAANRAACGPYPADAPPHARPFTLPRGRLLAVWQWNYARKAMQAAEGESLFVPRIWFVRLGNEVGTSVVWLDAMAVRAPKVDLVVFSREMLAPRRALGRRADVAVAPWSVIAASVTGQAFYDTRIVNWRVTDPRVLNGLARTVARLRGTTDVPDVIPAEQVLDREGFES